KGRDRVKVVRPSIGVPVGEAPPTVKGRDQQPRHQHGEPPHHQTGGAVEPKQGRKQDAHGSRRHLAPGPCARRARSRQILVMGSAASSPGLSSRRCRTPPPMCCVPPASKSPSLRSTRPPSSRPSTPYSPRPKLGS